MEFYSAASSEGEGAGEGREGKVLPGVPPPHKYNIILTASWEGEGRGVRVSLDFIHGFNRRQDSLVVAMGTDNPATRVRYPILSL